MSRLNSLILLATLVPGLRTTSVPATQKRLLICVEMYSALVAVALGLFAVSPMRARGADDLATDYYHDFRGRPLPVELTYFNAEEGKFFQLEPEGLRITLPKTWTHPWGGVGFRTSFGFGEDFEVTTTVEILQAETPPSGYGVGVCLYVAKLGGGGATVCRVVRAGNHQVLLWDVTDTLPGERPHVDEGVSPCTDNVVRLRLKRTGSTLHYLWAPGTQGDDFREIHQCEFGTAEIERVRLAALTGRRPCNLDVRLLDLRIRSQTSEMPAADAPKARWKVWLSIGLVVSLSLGIWLAMHRGRGPGKMPGLPFIQDAQIRQAK